MPQITKRKKIAKSFGIASRSYDVSARLQRHTGKQLIPWVAEFNQGLLLDLGCGTGFFSSILNSHFDHVVGVDISFSMLKFAKARNGVNTCFAKADAMHLPFADNTFSVVYSNLVMQWCEPLEQVFAEVLRVLKPGGRFVFTTLLDGTLLELKQAWQSVDNDKHVNDFHQSSFIEQALTAANAKLLLSETSQITLEYENVLHLAHELKGLGANFVPQKQQKGLAGKDKWRQMTEFYNNHFSQDGIVPATYQVYYAMVSK